MTEFIDCNTIDVKYNYEDLLPDNLRPLYNNFQQVEAFKIAFLKSEMNLLRYFFNLLPSSISDIIYKDSLRVNIEDREKSSFITFRTDNEYVNDVVSECEKIFGADILQYNKGSYFTEFHIEYKYFQHILYERILNNGVPNTEFIVK